MADDFSQRQGAHLEQRVDVVRHHNPRAQVVALAMIKPEGVIHQLRNLRPAELTRAVALVQPGFELKVTLAVILDLEQRGPLGAQRGGIGVRQMEGDELGQPRFVAVWKVSAFVPAAKTAHRILTFRRRRVAAFACDQFAYARIVRRAGAPWLGRLVHTGIWP